MKQLNNIFKAFSTKLQMLLFLLAFLPNILFSATVSPTELTLKVGGEDGVIEVSPEGTYFYINSTYQSSDGGETWVPVYSFNVDVTQESSKVIVHPKVAGSTGFTIVCNDGTSFYISIVVRAENSFTALTEEGVEMTFNVTNEERKYCTVAAKCIDLETTGKVTVPSVANGYRVTSFEYEAFQNCSQITDVVLPESVSSISWNYLFRGCTNLESVFIPKNLAQVGYGWFMGCESLKSVVVDPENTSLDSRDNCNAIIKTYSNSMVSACPATIIPETVTDLAYAAFNNFSSLESIYIPASVTSIYGWEFENCTNLKEITFAKSIADMGEGRIVMGCNSLEKVIVLDDNPCEIIDNAFNTEWDTWTTATLYVPAGCKEKYMETAGWNKFENIVEIGAADDIVIDETNFPDENFRNWVLAQDYGADGILTDNEIAAVFYIDVHDKSIADLKGVEYFTALTELSCYRNQLTLLDVSKNTALTYLDCCDNLLISLDVSKNTALTTLLCSINQLTSLDVSKNTALTTLSCSNNQLTSLDVSKNTALWFIYCDGNQLTSLDVSQNTALVVLYCHYNQIKGAAMDALIAGLPSTGGTFYAIEPDNSSEQNVVTKPQVASAKEKRWTPLYWNNETRNWEEYEGSDPEIAPVDQGESIDIGTELDENTNLDGNVVGDVYYCISSGDGSYDPEEGCIVVTKPTDDSAIDGKDIFGEDFKDGYTGFVFMVAPGKGTINVEAETTGNMVLKVRVGDNAPTQMEVDGKTKVSFSYDVSEPTMVFIYGSIAAAGAKGVMKAAGTDALKIYGIEVTSETNGIEAIDNGQLTIDNSPVYNLNGQRVISSPSGRPGGVPTKGIYIQNGKKVLVK